MVISVSDKKLKILIKESVREVLKSEVMQLRALVVPEVSQKEQKDIERRYGKPSKKSVKSYNVRI